MRYNANSTTNMNASRSNDARINTATLQGEAFIEQWEKDLLNNEFSVRQLFKLCFILLAEMHAMNSFLPDNHGYKPTFTMKDLEE